MDDLINRQDAIDAVIKHLQLDYEYAWGVREAINGLPSVQPEYKLDEWCEDCKEYDREKHSCSRFNRVIRETVKEAQPEVVQCRDCKHWMCAKYDCTSNDGTQGGVWYSSWCDLDEDGFEWQSDDFCSRAEKRG